jgi:hypothetical protein
MTLPMSRWSPIANALTIHFVRKLLQGYSYLTSRTGRQGYGARMGRLVGPQVAPRWSLTTPQPPQPSQRQGSVGGGQPAQAGGDIDTGRDGGLTDRSLHLDTTIGGAGKLNGDLTPQCTAALQAVLESLGKRRGPEDLRTKDQRLHDALEDA